MHVADFTEHVARWNYEMCMEHRGQVVLAGITFSLFDFGLLLFSRNRSPASAAGNALAYKALSLRRIAPHNRMCLAGDT